MPNKTKKIPNAVFNVPYAHGAENMQRIYFIWQKFQIDLTESYIVTLI